MSDIDHESVMRLLIAAVHEVAPRFGSVVISAESDLILDVGLDSVDLVEVLLLIETSLETTIDLQDDFFEGVVNAGQLADRVIDVVRSEP